MIVIDSPAWGSRKSPKREEKKNHKKNKRESGLADFRRILSATLARDIRDA